MRLRLLHCVLSCVALLLPFGADAQQVKLRAALQVAVSDLFVGVSLVDFKTEVEKRSDGP